MENQQRPSRYKPLQTNEAWDKLIGSGEDLKLQGSLGDAQARSVIEAIEILKAAQTSARRKKYKRFLYDVLRVSSPPAVLVCAVALGQAKAAEMKKSNRDLLIRQIEINKDHRDINHHTLQSLAISYQIPNSVNDVPTHALPLSRNAIKRHRKRKRATANPQDSIIPATEALQLDGLQNSPSDLTNPAPQKRPNMGSYYQVTDEQPRLGSPQISGNAVLPGDDQYWSFSFMGRHMIENLPEPFLTGMKMSNLWRQENERGGLAVTNCLSMYLPKTLNEDALCVVRIGYDDGFRICNLFGFGDPDIPV